MSLRIYFNPLKLRQNEQVTLWQQSKKATEPINRENAAREDWKLFGILDIRLDYDETAGLPFVELGHFETRVNEDPWPAIMESQSATYYFITESWIGDQAAGEYYQRRPNLDVTAIITRNKNLANLEFKMKPTQEGARILLETYQRIRRNKLGWFRTHAYDKEKKK